VARAVIGLFAGDKAAQADCRQLAPLLTAELAKEPDSLPLLQQLSWGGGLPGPERPGAGGGEKAVAVLPIGRTATSASINWSASRRSPRTPAPRPGHGRDP
jgi:hypothetical protein